jgi:hypothetical protein
MRTSQRALIAIVVALGALVVASIASASAASPATVASETLPMRTSFPGMSGGGGMPGATCAIDVPDCNDADLGGHGLTVCEAETASDDPNTPVSSGCIVNDTPDDPAGEPQIVEPTPGMTNVVPTAFDTATIGDDDTTLTIVFWSGVEPCSVLDRVDVSYGADAVTVALFQGSDPNAGDVACIEIAVQKQVTITLNEPLAGRAVVDGAA